MSDCLAACACAMEVPRRRGQPFRGWSVELHIHWACTELTVRFPTLSWHIRATADCCLYHPSQSWSKMSNSEETCPIQVGKRSLEAIIQGVAAKLWENPPTKHADIGPNTSSGPSEGEYLKHYGI